MKFTAIILLSACLTASAKGFTQGISLSEKNAPLTKLFTAIEKQSGYVFFFNYDALKGAKPVTIEVKNLSLIEILNICFQNQPFSYEIVNKTVVVKQKDVELKRQEDVPLVTTIDVSGKVTDADGNPLVGASVKVKGTSNGVTTDNNGAFVLKGVDEAATLEVSYAEHQPIEVKVGNRNNITIALKRVEGSLQEVVINKGYYSEKQRLSTGNVATIKSADIQKQPVNNPLLALQGRVPGLEITQGSGIPGSSLKVRIRGQNSFNNGNEPLYIIDGVPYTSQLLPGLGTILGAAGGDLQGNQIYGNPLSFINPADIESIDVLKDADATAIYGSRAANGAILITTKKGKSGKIKVDINAYSGWGKVTRTVPLLNLRQYLDMRYEAFKNDVANPDPNRDFDLTLWDTTRNTDWQKYFIGGTARYNNLQASVSGGNNQTQYLIGSGYSKETTVFPGDFSDTKASVHFNITSSSVSQKFKIMLTGTYLSDNNQLLHEDLTRYSYLAPNAPPLFNTDGSLNWAFNSAGSATWDNPLAYMMRKYKNQTNNLIANGTVGYMFIPGLEIKTSLGYTNQQSKEISTYPLASINPNNSPPISNSNFADNIIKSWIIEPQLSYSTKIGKGKFEILVGSTFQSNVSEGTVLNASGFSTDALIENKKAATTFRITSTTNLEYKYNALFGRVNYNWADKYLINITGRRDGSSRFGPDRRFHNFGAVGAGWIFSNENFIRNNLSFLNFGKIRGSYGTTGSDQIGDYRYLDLYFPTTFNYQGFSGLRINNLFNPDLAWEETKKFELGVELGLFNDRVNISGSFFKNRSSNQLLGYALPSTTGFRTIDANQNAEIQNKGFELVFNATPVQNKNLRWNSSLNFTTAKNKLVSVGANYFGDITLVGHSLNSSYVSGFLGIDPTTGRYQFLGKNGNAASLPDSFYFDQDLNPKFYGGFQNTFSFKGFQLDALFQFVEQIGKNNNFFNHPGMGGISTGAPNQPTSVLDRWQKIGDESSIQRFSQNGSLISSNEAAQGSNASYSDASFIRLKNVGISYSFSSAVRDKIRTHSLRIYLQCQNLFTVTNYKGLDPETRSIYSLPPLRVITAGVQVTF